MTTSSSRSLRQKGARSASSTLDGCSAIRACPGGLEPLALDCRNALVAGTLAAGPAAEFISRLWRHSVAVSLAARSLAREANDPDPDGVARAGLLCRLGCWAVAAVDPEWMAGGGTSQRSEPAQRELADLGTDLDDLGRRLAERWGASR